MYGDIYGGTLHGKSLVIAQTCIHTLLFSVALLTIDTQAYGIACTCVEQNKAFDDDHVVVVVDHNQVFLPAPTFAHSSSLLFVTTWKCS